MTAPVGLTRDALRTIHRVLVLGVVVAWLMAAGLRLAGVAPLLREAPFPEGLIVGVCLAELLVGWYWCRRRVPVRRLRTPVTAYWQDPRVGRNIALSVFLLEGGTVLAIVWSIVAGSWLSSGIGLTGVASLIFNRPSRFEEPVP